MILVTGATGHVGNVLLRRLVATSHQVRALVLPGDPCRAIEGLDVECYEGSILDPAVVDAAMVDVDTIYHLAGIISIVPGTETLMHRVNVDGVRNVTEAALKHGVERLVHVSSIHAFQRMPEGTLVDERTPLATCGAEVTYDRTKALGTQVVLDAGQRGLDAVIVCPTAIIGPYDFGGSLLGQALINFARRRLHLLVHGAYDFVDVRDIVNGLLLARSRGRPGELYILAGTYATLSEAKRLVQATVGRHSGHVTLPSRMAMAFADGMQHVYRLTRCTPRFTPYSLRTLADNAHFCCRKAQQELGFGARPLIDTMRDLVAWHLNPIAFAEL